jgi:hypothetical protein
MYNAEMSCHIFMRDCMVLETPTTGKKGSRYSALVRQFQEDGFLNVEKQWYSNYLCATKIKFSTFHQSM